jgi:hypothetical protein
VVWSWFGCGLVVVCPWFGCGLVVVWVWFDRGLFAVEARTAKKCIKKHRCQTLTPHVVSLICVRKVLRVMPRRRKQKP